MPERLLLHISKDGESIGDDGKLRHVYLHADSATALQPCRKRRYQKGVRMKNPNTPNILPSSFAETPHSVPADPSRQPHLQY